MASGSKIYPLSQAASPPPTVFVDAIDVVFDSTIPYDLRFFQSLDRFVQYEPWLERDKAMIDQLKSIGIEKGKPFRPDPKTQMTLNEAAREADAWLAARYDDLFHPPYFETSRWAVPATPDLIEAFGTHFDGGVSYRLTVPPNAPVTQYWSATVYDRATHALIRDQKFLSNATQTT